MKRILKTAPLVLGLLALVLAACLNPADPAEPDLDLYREVSYSGLNPGSGLGTRGIFDITHFFTFDMTALNLSSGTNRNYVELTMNTGRFKDNGQAVQAVWDSFEFKALDPIPTGNPAYTSYPESGDIGIKSVEVLESGTRIRITLDLNPMSTVSQVIQLRVKADKLEGARGEKIDTNKNRDPGEEGEDDFYDNWTVNGPSVTPIISLGMGAGQPRERQTLDLLPGGAGNITLLTGAPTFTFTPRPDDKYDVHATLTWNLAASLNGQETPSHIETTLKDHFFVEKYDRKEDRKESTWVTFEGDWVLNPSNGVATFTGKTTADEFEIFRINLTKRTDIITEGTYYGFKQKLSPVIENAPTNYDNAREEQQLANPAIPNTNFFTTSATAIAVNWINDKGGWIDLTLANAVLGVDPVTLVKENFRLYAASGTTANTVLEPVRGIPVDSVSQYTTGGVVHLIIRLDPEYKSGVDFDTNYGNNDDANNLQVWIGNVKVYIAGDEQYLGGNNVLNNNGTEDFFGLYQSLAANQL